MRRKISIAPDRNTPLAIQLLKRYLASGPVEEAPAFKAHYLLGMLLERQGDKSPRRANTAHRFLWRGNLARPSRRSTE